MDQQRTFQSKSGAGFVVPLDSLLSAAPTAQLAAAVPLHLQLPRRSVNCPNRNGGNGLKQQLETFRLDKRKNLPIITAGIGCPLTKRRFSVTMKWHVPLGQVL